MTRLTILVLCLATVACDPLREKGVDSNMKKLTPILPVESIEPCLPFWVDQLGFTKTMEVPQGDRLVFVGLAFGSVEVMLQTIASIAEDMPALAPSLATAHQFLYIEVEDLDQIKARLEDGDIVQPERLTFYGAREVGTRSPGGHYVTFAEMGKEGEGTK